MIWKKPFWRSKDFGFVLVLLWWGVVAIIAWSDYARYDPMARKEEQVVVRLYNSIPTPQFARLDQTTLYSYHKPHFAGIRATYLSNVPHARISDYYFSQLAKRGWRVCMFDDHSPYHEVSPIFENGDFFGELVFMRDSPDRYTFDLDWTDDPSPSCPK